MRLRLKKGEIAAHWGVGQFRELFGHDFAAWSLQSWHDSQPFSIPQHALRRDSTLKQAEKTELVVQLSKATGAALATLEKKSILLEGKIFDQNKRIKDTIAGLASQLKKQEDSRKDETALDEQQSRRDWLLHSGLLAFRGQDPKNPYVLMRHHNAQADYRLMSSLNDSRTNYELDRHEVAVLVHNNRDTVKVTTETLPFTENSIVSIVLSPVFNSLASLGQIKELLNRDDRIEDEAERLRIQKAIKKCKKTVTNFFAAKLFADNAQAMIDFYRSEFCESDFPEADRADMKPAYFTQLIVPRPDTLASSTMKYTITNAKDGKAVRTETYTLSKTQRFLPTAGLGYSFYNQPDVTVNADGSLKMTKVDGFFPLIGLKIYFAKTNVSDPHFVIHTKRKPLNYDHSFDWRKVHVVLGINALSPTRSFVGGLGVDLWAGLSLQGGCNLVRARQPIFDQGHTTGDRNYLTTAWFAALTIDPPLFGQIIKLFKKI